MTKKLLNDLSYEVIGAAIEVHKSVGPGLLENVYQCCLSHEFQLRKIRFVSEMLVPVMYKDMQMMTSLRTDFFVEECLVVEIKAVQEVLPIHEAQIISYMKLLQAPKGILINFHSTHIFKEGQKTYVNDLFSKLPEG